jgi:hypothetical protein
MHLTANSINNMLDRLIRLGWKPDPHMYFHLDELVFFFDEVLSHLMMTVSLVLLHTMLLFEVHQHRQHTIHKAKQHLHPMTALETIALTFVATMFGGETKTALVVSLSHSFFPCSSSDDFCCRH